MISRQRSSNKCLINTKSSMSFLTLKSNQDRIMDLNLLIECLGKINYLLTRVSKKIGPCSLKIDCQCLWHQMKNWIERTKVQRP